MISFVRGRLTEICEGQKLFMLWKKKQIRKLSQPILRHRTIKLEAQRSVKYANDKQAIKELIWK